MLIYQKKDGLICWQFKLKKLNLDKDKDDEFKGLFSKQYFWVTI